MVVLMELLGHGFWPTISESYDQRAGQAIIRDAIVPGLREASDAHDRRLCIHSVTDLVESATKLSDAIGRLRGTAPTSEIRQRITVEKVQRLSAPEGEGG